MGWTLFGDKTPPSIVQVRDSMGNFHGDYYVERWPRLRKYEGKIMSTEQLNSVIRYSEATTVGKSYYTNLGRIVDDVDYLRAARAEGLL